MPPGDRPGCGHRVEFADGAETDVGGLFFAHGEADEFHAGQVDGLVQVFRADHPSQRPGVDREFLDRGVFIVENLGEEVVV